jgi:hypothetical protein
MLTPKREEPMRLIVKIVATLLILAGVMWFLQGIGVVPGSTMTGEAKWAAIGAACAVAGVVAWVIAARRA